MTDTTKTERVTFVLRVPPARPAVRPPAPPTDDRATVAPPARGAK